jgi:ABC-type transport system involved in Fe-S cluster assembly fused permease/ATPase subunit
VQLFNGTISLIAAIVLMAVIDVPLLLVTLVVPAVIAAADRILLVEGGRVRAQGTHVELVEADDLYRELAATQLTA